MDGRCFLTIAVNQEGAFGVKIDSTNVYWCTYGSEAANYTDGTAVKAPLTGGAAITVGTNISPAGFGLDETYVYLYSQEQIVKVPIGGGAATPLASGQTNVRDIAVDDANVYWIDGGQAVNNYEDGTVMRISKSGGSAVPIASAQKSPKNLKG
jgi:hypothetical protein